MLNGTIKHHLEKYMLSDMKLVSKLLEDFYVDDFVSGVPNVEEGQIFRARAMEVMDEAVLELRKWVTNDSDLRKVFNEDSEFSWCKQV